MLHVVRDVRVLREEVPQRFIHTFAGIAGFSNWRFLCQCLAAVDSGGHGKARCCCCTVEDVT